MNATPSEERKKSRRCETRWMQAVLKEQLAVLDDKLDAQGLDELDQWLRPRTILILRHAGQPWNQ